MMMIIMIIMVIITTTTVIILSLCQGVQNISFTFHVFVVYNHLKLLLKLF